MKLIFFNISFYLFLNHGKVYNKIYLTHHFKCRIKWHSFYSYCCVTITTLSKATSLLQTEGLIMIKQLLTHAPLFATPWTVTCQVPLSMGFFRQEYWRVLPFPLPGDLSDWKETELTSPVSPALQADSLP